MHRHARKKSCWKANVGFIGNAVTFLLAVNWNNFVNSNGFLINQRKISKKTIFFSKQSYKHSVLRGATVSVQFGIYRISHTVICCLLFVSYLPLFDELCRRSINFAHSCVSHESQFSSQIASYCIHFACCNSPMGLNILFCADRLKTNIDGILHLFSNYIDHSYYNRSIADVQQRASSFLFKLISTRDSRQSYL